MSVVDRQARREVRPRLVVVLAAAVGHVELPVEQRAAAWVELARRNPSAAVSLPSSGADPRLVRCGRVRRPSGSGSAGGVSGLRYRPHLDRQDHQHDAAREGEDPDQPDQRENAARGPNQQRNTE